MHELFKKMMHPMTSTVEPSKRIDFILLHPSEIGRQQDVPDILMKIKGQAGEPPLMSSSPHISKYFTEKMPFGTATVDCKRTMDLAALIKGTDAQITDIIHIDLARARRPINEMAFKETMEIPFTLKMELDKKVYVLYAIFIHHGDNPSTGHWTVEINHPQWGRTAFREYNDAHVGELERMDEAKLRKLWRQASVLGTIKKLKDG